MLILVVPEKKSFDDIGLTYAVPENMEIHIGNIVKVPFRTEELLALVIDIDTSLQEKNPDIKYVLEVFSYFEISPLQVFLTRYIAKEFFCLIHNTFGLFLPRHLRELIRENKKEKIEKYIGKKGVTESDEMQDATLQTLNDIQFQTLHEIKNNLHKEILLWGVTGSGKTEIYAHIIESYRNIGKQVLLLLPEIILGNQISQRLQKIFGDEIVLLHSDISDAKKTNIWTSIYHGDTKIIIGTRSALFYPYTNLGCIIMDEEHDESYNSDSAPRFQSKILCSVISKFLDIPVIFSSGTPSITTMYRAAKGDIGLVHLLERYKKL